LVLIFLVTLFGDCVRERFGLLGLVCLFSVEFVVLVELVLVSCVFYAFIDSIDCVAAGPELVLLSISFSSNISYLPSSSSLDSNRLIQICCLLFAVWVGTFEVDWFSFDYD